MAFVEAMYGCDYSMTKEKFEGHYEFIDFDIPSAGMDVETAGGKFIILK